ADLARAVVVHGRTENQSMDHVAVGQRAVGPLQHDERPAGAVHEAARIAVERTAMAVRREDPVRAVQMASVLRELYRGAAGQCHITVTVHQGPTCLVHRDERGRARGLYRYRRTVEIELVGDARRRVVLIVAEPELEKFDIVARGRIVGEMLKQIAARARADEDSYIAVDAA